MLQGRLAAAKVVDSETAAEQAQVQQIVQADRRRLQQL